MYFYLHYKTYWDLLFLDSYFYHCNFKLKFCSLQCSAYFRNTFITYLLTNEGSYFVPLKNWADVHKDQNEYVILNP